MRIALKFAYNGKQFHGFARQPNLRTIEGEIINFLNEKKIIRNTKESNYSAASRTDKGVSALANIISFNTNKSEKRIINILSDIDSDIIFYGIKKVTSDFYPRYAEQRQYQYYLKINNLDIKKIISASSSFTNKHDFSNFARIESFKDPIRTIDNIIFTKTTNYLIIDFFAQTFLWNQIRRIVSSLEKIGQGIIEKSQIDEALKKPEKKIDFGLSPVEFLILKEIFYKFEFQYLEELKMELKKFENKILSSFL
jgi:tRNA pseudouridine38-40 synthase